MKEQALFLLLPLIVALGGPASAQTRINFSNVMAVDHGDTLRGADVTVQLNRAEGSQQAILLQSGDISVKIGAKVSTQNVQRSSLKDSAVNLVMDIALKAGKDKDSKQVQKIFYMDQERTTKVTQRYNFKHGIDMRTVTLLFNATIE